MSALKSGSTGRWEVFDGFLPEAVIIVSVANMDDLSARICSIIYPYIFRGVSQVLTQTVEINRHNPGGLESAEKAILLFREKGATFMSSVLSDCATRLLRAGVPAEAMKDAIDAAVVQEVMES